MRVSRALGVGVFLASATALPAAAMAQDLECRPDGSSTAEVSVGSNARLGWTQGAADTAALVMLTFRLSVDGAVHDITEPACVAGAEPGSYECLGALPPMEPGVHQLCVGAAAAGADVAVSWSAALAVRVETSPSTTAVRATAPLVEGLDDPTDLAVLPDGRILVAERSGTVRVVRPGSSAAVAQRLPDVVTGDGRGLLSIAVDRDFAATHRVFVLHSVDDGLRLARFELADDTLTGRAILRDGLPAAASRPATSVRMGPDRKLYVALDDGGTPSAALDLGALQGKVLRLNVDGTTPKDQESGLPVHLAGFSRPTGLAWTGDPPSLWVADRRADGVVLVRGGAAVTPATRDAPVRFAAGKNAAAPPGIPRDAHLASGSDGVLLFAAAGVSGDVLRLVVQPTGLVLAVPAVGQDRLPGQVRAIATGPENELYVATDRAVFRVVVTP